MNGSAAPKNTESERGFSHREARGWNTFNIFIFLLLCLLNISKMLKTGFTFSFYDVFLPVITLVYLLALIDHFISKTTFNLNDGQLTVKKRKLFYTKSKSYEIARMEDLEVERVQIRKYPLKAKFTDEYIVTFFYDDKEVALGLGLQKFDANGVYDAIVGNCLN